MGRIFASEVSPSQSQQNQKGEIKGTAHVLNGRSDSATGGSEEDWDKIEPKVTSPNHNNLPIESTVQHEYLRVSIDGG